MYQAVIQTISPIVDKDGNERKIVFETYHGTFPTSEDANEFAKRSRVGIKKSKDSIILQWSGDEGTMSVVDFEDVHYYENNPLTHLNENDNLENYPLETLLELIWNYDDFGGDEGFSWLSLEAYGSNKIEEE